MRDGDDELARARALRGATDPLCARGDLLEEVILVRATRVRAVRQPDGFDVGRRPPCKDDQRERDRRREPWPPGQTEHAANVFTSGPDARSKIDRGLSQ
jgi:hypothetical protein